MPLTERLIKQLTEFSRRPQRPAVTLLAIELLVAKSLAQVASELIPGLIRL